MFLIFDTETTGLPKNYNAPLTDFDNWPRVVQLAWQIHNDLGELVEVKNFIVKPEGFDIPFNAEKIHGISTERAQKQGMPLEYVLNEFNEALKKSTYVVGHNIDFDINIMGCEFLRKDVDSPLTKMLKVDTCTELTASFCQLPGGKGGRFKLPQLTELHTKLFNEAFNEAHNASADVEATARCFLELIRVDVIKAQDLKVESVFIENFKRANQKPFELIGLNIQPYSPEELTDGKIENEELVEGPTKKELQENLQELKEFPFAHLHNHTQFSILQSTTQVQALAEAAAKENMPAVAITDHGNMMAAFHFVSAVSSINKGRKAKREEEIKEKGSSEINELKAIVGCEFNICRDHKDKSVKDNGYQIPIIAKNKAGYHNLAKLASAAYIDGYYYLTRIDKELLVQYKENLIVFTGGVYGEIPSLILNVGEKQAEEAFVWWHEQFQDDFYIELLRHGLPENDRVNDLLLKWAEKYNVKYFAANNTYYLAKEDANAHDILLCVKEGEKQSTPKGRGRGFRFGFPNDEFYFKSQTEMKNLFKDLPNAIKTISEIVGKIESYSLYHDVLLPKFDIPKEFVNPEDELDGGKRGENAYLRHLTYQGAKERYGEITPEISERLDFELETIANTGYPGYFLIVQDFTREARNMGVSVGPGRGSAAGSAVAYCVGITNVDPIKYDLLFERFLNPDRVSLPDIDIDFDDEGRGRVIQYVINKYGSSQVAQIITYGTMAAKSSIRDTARVLDLPLPDSDRIAKLVPNMKLNKLFKLKDNELKEKLNKEEQELANQLIQISKSPSLEGQTVRQAVKLEGSVRNTGIHACGVIITPSDIRELIPVATSKDGPEQGLWCTQFDNSVVESAGLLKMDFLGLKTLTLIKDAIAIVKKRHGIDIDPDAIPLEDELTYELFQRGETVGVFQYESPGMQKHLKDLKPTVFGDLIAMNALYRPGPLEYIPSFIKRKHGLEEITYDLEGMEEYLEETYGITVYQEQVMLLSQKLAGFTKGEADTLRKAMGKKKLDLLATLKPQFLDQGAANGHDKAKLEKVWVDWEAFASYAFNKSHSTCYAWVAFQTAYLKAHYPAEYMASVLSNNMSDIKQVTFFMDECKRMGVPVLGPDVNESEYKFTVNDKGAIRFGLGAIKGVGEGAVEAVVRERNENGVYTNIFDFTKRIDLRACNRRTIESLAIAGAFDSFPNVHRAQYFHDDGSGRTFIELAIKYGANFQENANSSQVSLFGESSEVEMPEPPIPQCEEWNTLYKLSKEREVVGVYITGHPLDDYKLEFKYFCNANLSIFADLDKHIGKEVKIGGIITASEQRISNKNNNPYGLFTVEDYQDSHQFYLFSEDYLKFKEYLQPNLFVYIQGQVMQRGRDNYKRVELKISKIDLLSNVRERIAKELKINMNLRALTNEFLVDFTKMVSENEGNCKVNVRLYDEEENLDTQMLLRGARVKIENELLEKLDSYSGLTYELS